MSKLNLIIRREFIAKVRNKSFIIMTFLSPLLFVGMGVFIGFLANMNKDTKTKIGILDTENVLLSQFENDKEYVYFNLNALDFETAKDSAESGLDGLLYVPKTADVQELKAKVTYVSEDSPSIEFISEVENKIDALLTNDSLVKLGFDYKKIEQAQVDASLKLEKFSGEESLKGINEIKVAIGGACGYLIMMFIIIYGNFVMRSVIEEKTSRIIEIIISSVKPFQLMMGKIIGNSLAGILQFVIWALVGGILFFVVTNYFGLQMGASSAVTGDMAANVPTDGMQKLQMYLLEIAQLPLGTLFVSLLIYFIGGYFLYSSFYAAIGAAVDSETDSQQFLLPIIMPLMLGVYIGFFTVINDPHGTVATIFSFIPLTSPIVMLMRIPFGVPIWQLILSIAILYASFGLVVWMAAKIYRIGILMHGKKPTWKELYKWLKY